MINDNIPFPTVIYRCYFSSSHDNVEPKNLWDALQAEYDKEFLENPDSVPKLGHLSINDIGNSWSMETGYPVLEVRKEENQLHLKQNRFQTDFKSVALSKWIIPITYARSFDLAEQLKKTSPIDFLQTGERTITVDVTKDEFVLFNNQQTGKSKVSDASGRHVPYLATLFQPKPNLI